MLKDAYQTTACKAYEMKKVVLQIEEAFVKGELVPAQDSDLPVLPDVGSVYDVYMVTDSSESVSPFAHPILIEKDEGYRFIAVDVRPFMGRTRDGEIKINAKTDLDFLMLRAGMQNYWTVQGPEDLAALGSFPVTAYARWVSEAITRRMGIDAETQVRLLILSAYFYLCQFKDKDQINENAQLKMAGQVARALNINAESVLGSLEGVDHIGTLSEFIEESQKIGNVRLEKLNPGLLVAVTSTGWFGANAHEIMAVALEHPPTFISLVHASLNHRGYQRSLFAKNIQSLDRRGVGKDFTQNLQRLPRIGY